VTQGRNVLTVTGARVIMELQGISCLSLSLIAPQRKGMAVPRTFGEAVTEWAELAQAVSTYATRAGEMLRQHGLLACSMTVFLQTNRFVPGEFYSNAATFGREPTQDSLSRFHCEVQLGNFGRVRACRSAVGTRSRDGSTQEK
jgi:DNA polymerase V